MKKTYELAGQVMGFFDAFKGSRPAIDNERILIVRGRSRKVLPLNEFDSKLTEIGEILGGTELDATSEKISEILEVGDKNIKRSENVTSDVDNKGFMRMQEELESMTKEQLIQEVVKARITEARLKKGYEVKGDGTVILYGNGNTK